MDMATFVDGIVGRDASALSHFSHWGRAFDEGLRSRGQPDHGQADRPNDVGREVVFERH